MFEQTLIEGRVRTNRGWTVITSFSLQIATVCVALAVPLVKPELLPHVLQTGVFLGPPLPAAPPPPDIPRAVRPSKTAPKLMTTAGLRITGRIPDQIATIEDPPETEIGILDSIGPASSAARRVGGPSSMWTNTASPPPPPPVAASKHDPQPEPVVRIRQGGDVQDALLIHRVMPVYPPLARAARIQGAVIFTAIIGRDGVIGNLQFVSGHPLLVQAATDAVRQWRYRPTQLNGAPVEVITNIQVNFTLSQ